MTGDTRILVAIDDSDASMRAVQYVANFIGDQNGFHVHLFHVLHPLPPELLEHRGATNPTEEERIEAQQHEAIAEWIKRAKKAEQPVFKHARAILRKAGIPSRKVKTEYCPSVNTQDVIPDVLEAARANRCRTIVVGRESFSGLKRLFRRHIGDALVRRGQGFTVWVVE